MNLSSIKSAAEAAMQDSLALDFWREDISPEDVIRLVEVARIFLSLSEMPSIRRRLELLELDHALEGIEP